MRERTTSTPSSSASELPASPPTDKTPAFVYALTIFLSAFLLFQVQPLVAKEILPWFGGSAGVWTTCMLFFQLALLGGYAYAHWLANQAGRRASIIHRILLVLSLIALPIVPSTWWKPADGSFPISRILGLLAVTVGPPYFLLASTSPLLQTWYARARGKGIPYRFFALSNFGSMLALLSYPVLVEPEIPLRAQAWFWSGGFLIFAGLCFWLAAKSRDYRSGTVARHSRGQYPSWSTRLTWLGLAACPSGLLLAVTNHVTQNIAAIPFLWVLPLSLYLLSFILTFESSRWYWRRFYLGLLAVAIGSMGYAVTGVTLIRNLPFLISLFSGGLFVCCMVCHGELARRKPAPEFLTSFYLMISVGGAIGGLFVAAFAPVVFPALFEFPVLLVLAPALVLAVTLGDRPPKGDRKREFERSQFQAAWFGAAVATVALAVFLVHAQFSYLHDARLIRRNFYGTLRVTEDDQGDFRELAHGTINHGEQFNDALRRRLPITYYAPSTGIGLLMTDLQKRGPFRIGVIGLGTGTMAAWARAGDTVRYYEINPLVVDIAHKQFTYLRDTPAKVDIVLGDARLSMERESSQHFDVLVVDAFSGDSIPVHLLTREAFAVYWRHLRPEGVLAVHTSNKYLNLAPAVATLARQLRYDAHLIESEKDEKSQTFASDWVLVGRDETKRFPWIEDDESEIEGPAGLRPWTDDFSNLWKILR